jgi:hypothetical protein
MRTITERLEEDHSVENYSSFGRSRRRQKTKNATPCKKMSSDDDDQVPLLSANNNNSSNNDNNNNNEAALQSLSSSDDSDEPILDANANGAAIPAHDDAFHVLWRNFLQLLRHETSLWKYASIVNPTKILLSSSLITNRSFTTETKSYLKIIEKLVQYEC